MAAPAPSPLRRWKRFLGAFESVDAAIEAADPVNFSRHEFRSARCDIVELLCDAADDDQAERLCLVLDDVMAESLETLRLIPAMPGTLAESLGALRMHESERVRVLAGGIMNRLESRTSATTKQPAKTHPAGKTDARATRPANFPETSAKKKKASDQEGICYEEKMKLAKRKINEGYREADDAKRQRKVQVVKAPESEMPKQRERSRARFCGSSMVNRTSSATRLSS